MATISETNKGLRIELWPNEEVCFDKKTNEIIITQKITAKVIKASNNHWSNRQKKSKS